MENAVRRLGTPVCPKCGCGMMTDLQTLDYFCPACKFQLTRAEMRKMEADNEEQVKKDAKAFM